MHRAGKEVIKLLLYSDLLCTRFTLGLAELLWSITLFMPEQTFKRPTYAHMVSTGLSEEAWAILWLITGLTQMYILFSGKHHDLFAVCFAGYNMCLWWFVIIGCYLSVGMPAAMSAELACCVAASWVYLRSGWMPKAEGELYGIATK